MTFFFKLFKEIQMLIYLFKKKNMIEQVLLKVLEWESIAEK